MARDHRHQLRFACSARDQALRRVGVARQKRHRPQGHRPQGHRPQGHRPHGPHAPGPTGHGLLCAATAKSSSRNSNASPGPFRLSARWSDQRRAASSVERCVAAPASAAGWARRPTRLTRAAFPWQALHLLLPGAEGDIDLQVRLSRDASLYRVPCTVGLVFAVCMCKSVAATACWCQCDGALVF
jgi:hypothetical protein